jgi:hypothetical protein
MSRPPLAWVARARTPAISGAASEVPAALSIVMSGTERMRLCVIDATQDW